VKFSVAGTLTGTLQIAGLPFTPENITDAYSTAAMDWSGLSTNWVYVVGTITPNIAKIDLKGLKAAAASSRTDFVTADLGNATDFIFSACYRASA
jgi:hypothetical protein